MSYYHRDEKGNWFIKDGKESYLVEFSGSMEVAYTMGKIAALDQLREGMDETTMQIRDTQIRGMDSTPIPG
jgi:hypothetical protein